MAKKGFQLTFAALLMTGALAGCGGATEETTNNEETKEPAAEEKLEGSITASGSTALQPLAEEAGNEFMAKHSGVTVQVQGGGSGTGINQVSDGSVQIGNSDVPAAEKLKDAEKAKELKDNVVAGIAFAVVVNKDANVDDLTKQQIKDIFSGKVKNWKEVGGADQAIQVVNRPASSGTRATFEKTILDGTKADDTIGTVQDSNGQVEQTVNATPGAVSYLAMSYLVGDKQDVLKTVKIDGVEVSNENISAGKYPFWANEYMVTKGEPTGVVKAFIDYVAGSEFEATVEKMGYIPASKLPKK